jgi:caffeoyl-CoA O-methyltransferase
MKTYSLMTDAIETYVEKTFQPEDEILVSIRERAAKAGLPDIHIGRMDGLHLEVLTRAMNAKKVVEIGTLAGYSGTCMARGIPAGGTLFTFEFEPKHAEVALETFKKAGVADKVQIFVGPAISNLTKIEKEGPFDLVFIDADKPSYPAYLEWAIKNVRKGGAILADNTFAMGEIGSMGPNASQRVKNLNQYNASAATDKRLRSTILPTSDGLTFSVKL